MKRMLAAALACVGLAACGGGSAPKEFVVSVISPQTVAGQNADCDAAGNANYIVVDPNASFHILVYQGDSTHYYAEIPSFTGNGSGSTLEGTLASGTYSFTGTVTTETFAPDLNNKQIDDLQTTTVSLTIKDSGGNNVTGNFNYETRHTCTNLTQGDVCKAAGLPDANGNTVDCVTAGTLSGIELPNPSYQQGHDTPGNGGVGQNF